MVTKLKWKKTVSQKGNEWWIKGDYKGKYKNELPKQWIHLQESTPYIKRTFKGSNWNVRTPVKINKKTMYGKTISFKTKAEALKFVRDYIKKH